MPILFDYFTLKIIWWLLVGDRGWSGDEYERWLGELHCAQLLASSDATR